MEFKVDPSALSVCFSSCKLSLRRLSQPALTALSSCCDESQRYMCRMSLGWGKKTLKTKYGTCFLFIFCPYLFVAPGSWSSTSFCFPFLLGWLRLLSLTCYSKSLPSDMSPTLSTQPPSLENHHPRQETPPLQTFCLLPFSLAHCKGGQWKSTYELQILDLIFFWWEM